MMKNYKNPLTESISKTFHENEEGILLIDFVFAFMLLVGFSVMLFSISMTLTVTEVLQYITFSSARVNAVADVDRQTSEVRAKNKFVELYSSPIIQPFFVNEWFELEGNEPIVGDFTDTFSDRADRSTFHGVVLDYQAKILDKNIPLIGSTKKSVEGGAFKTRVHSFLTIEPSQRDCEIFLKERWEWLKENGEYQSPYLEQRKNSVNNYVRIADNGC